MPEQPVMAQALRGYQFFPHPDSPTLGVLRLDTQDDQHWFLVDQKTLIRLAEALQIHAKRLQPVQ